jgi:hypothetical protein
MDIPVPGNLYWSPKVPRSVSLKTTSSTMAMIMMMTTMRLAKMSIRGMRWAGKVPIRTGRTVTDGQAGGKT